LGIEKRVDAKVYDALTEIKRGYFFLTKQ